MLLRFVVYIMWMGANIFVVLVVCSLYGNEIGADGAACVADALRSNKTLTWLK